MSLPAFVRSAIRLFLFWVSLIFPAHALIVGSFNIRYDNQGDVRGGNSWTQRAPVVTSLIRFHNFDIVGTQEVLHHQLLDMEKMLPEYSHFGKGRKDGEDGGERVSIFYKKDKFRLVEGGTFWLSETPDVPGEGWDASLPRICTWAKFEQKNGKEDFFVFNTHFDHQGVQARLESALLILRKIEEIAGDRPVVLTGDFNVNQTSESYRSLLASGTFSDACETAAIQYALNGTANGFNPNGKTESRIDHVFLTKHFKALRYGVLTDTYRMPLEEDAEETESGNFPREVKFRQFQARLPSDHFPVLVEVEF